MRQYIFVLLNKIFNSFPIEGRYLMQLGETLPLGEVPSKLVRPQNSLFE